MTSGDLRRQGEPGRRRARLGSSPRGQDASHELRHVLPPLPGTVATMSAGQSPGSMTICVECCDLPGAVDRHHGPDHAIPPEPQAMKTPVLEEVVPSER